MAHQRLWNAVAMTDEMVSGWYAGPWADEVYYLDDRGRWHTSMTKLEDTSHITKTRLMAAGASVKVAGTCAACGGDSLYVMAGGHVTCSRLTCPDPTNVDDLLNDRAKPRPA